ncbi:uncharacterized protein EV420DRAFT_1484480 [Desarmillaria tabescens]|uniref:CCHC-type domain-containing protein n=1 Tax=Armillaria tabescens TaxID=1929756 RepID=A0AA39JLP0_ARMTA|nr:uncharacterized protein EV420DRAFT_1484480 [Desarmillaria tabescens]KAK0445057.1 hypothetical protein EV420DRAFT_1484480 [Desarmillaria tabescens]
MPVDRNWCQVPEMVNKATKAANDGSHMFTLPNGSEFELFIDDDGTERHDIPIDQRLMEEVGGVGQPEKLRTKDEESSQDEGDPEHPQDMCEALRSDHVAYEFVTHKNGEWMSLQADAQQAQDALHEMSDEQCTIIRVLANRQTHVALRMMGVTNIDPDSKAYQQQYNITVDHPTQHMRVVVTSDGIGKTLKDRAILQRWREKNITESGRTHIPDQAVNWDNQGQPYDMNNDGPLEDNPHQVGQETQTTLVEVEMAMDGMKDPYNDVRDTDMGPMTTNSLLDREGTEVEMDHLPHHLQEEVTIEGGWVDEITLILHYASCNLLLEGVKPPHLDIKSVKPYDGDLSMEVLWDWLKSLVVHLEAQQLGGPDRDWEQKLIIESVFRGKAKRWYHDHIIEVDGNHDWTFTTVILALNTILEDHLRVELNTLDELVLSVTPAAPAQLGNPKQGVGWPSSDMSHLTCYTCGKKGHIMRAARSTIRDNIRDEDDIIVERESERVESDNSTWDIPSNREEDISDDPHSVGRSEPAWDEVEYEVYSNFQELDEYQPSEQMVVIRESNLEIEEPTDEEDDKSEYETATKEVKEEGKHTVKYMTTQDFDTLNTPTLTLTHTESQ